MHMHWLPLTSSFQAWPVSELGKALHLRIFLLLQHQRRQHQQPVLALQLQLRLNTGVGTELSCDQRPRVTAARPERLLLGVQAAGRRVQPDCRPLAHMYSISFSVSPSLRPTRHSRPAAAHRAAQADEAPTHRMDRDRRGQLGRRRCACLLLTWANAADGLPFHLRSQPGAEALLSRWVSRVV